MKFTVKSRLDGRVLRNIAENTEFLWINCKKGLTKAFKICGFPRSASYAKAHGFDFFTTTLSISPLKNAEKLNQIGAELADTFGVRYLFSDFKKKEGYKKSTEISKEYHMYRQYYCGCVYSKRDRDREIVLRRQQEEQIL